MVSDGHIFVDEKKVRRAEHLLDYIVVNPFLAFVVRRLSSKSPNECGREEVREETS